MWLTTYVTKASYGLDSSSSIQSTTEMIKTYDNSSNKGLAALLLIHLHAIVYLCLCFYFIANDDLSFEVLIVSWISLFYFVTMHCNYQRHYWYINLDTDISISLVGRWCCLQCNWHALKSLGGGLWTNNWVRIILASGWFIRLCSARAVSEEEGWSEYCSW